jgi:hypothetical protein
MEVTLVRTVRRTLLLPLALITALSVSPAFVQDERVWIDVNFGLAASAAGDEALAFEGRLFSEPAAFAVAYPEPSRGAAFDFGGGYMFTPRVGVGVSFPRAGSRSKVARPATTPGGSRAPRAPPRGEAFNAAGSILCWAADLRSDVWKP